MVLERGQQARWLRVGSGGRQCSEVMGGGADGVRSPVRLPLMVSLSFPSPKAATHTKHRSPTADIDHVVVAATAAAAVAS